MFYGWYMVIAGAVINSLIGGICFYGFTSMVTPLAAGFSLSYAQISLAGTLRGVEIGALNPIVGFLVDRFRPNRMIIFGVIIAGIGLWLLARISGLLMFYLAFLTVSLGVSFATQLVPMSAIMKVFQRDTGKASGLLTIGIASGGLTIPLMTWLIDTYGWQTSLTILAFVVWGVGIPLSFVFRPRAIEKRTDPSKENDDHSIKHTANARLSEIVRRIVVRRSFWHIGIAFMLQVAVLGTVMLHIMPYFETLGIPRKYAGSVAASLPLVSIPARYLFGWLTDRYERKYIIALSMLATAVGMAIFASITGFYWGQLIGFIIVYSIGLGGFSPLLAPIVKAYFGASQFGTIYGIFSLFLTAGVTTMPLFAGFVYDILGNYGALWWGLGIVSLLGALTMITTPALSKE